MRVLAAQLNTTIGDLDGNTHKIIETLDKARAANADIVVFPELAICGYPPIDLVLHKAFIDAIEQHLERIIIASKGLMVIVGLVRRNLEGGEKGLYNSAAIIIDGHIVGFQDKQLLPTYDVFDERRYFDPGIRNQIWEYKGKKIGCLICEDIWQHSGEVSETHYHCDPVAELAKYKLDLLINISASPYQFEKPELRVEVCAASSKTLKCPLLLCCQVGANDQLIFDGYSMVVNAEGKLAHVAKGFEEDLLVFDIEQCPSQLFKTHHLEDLYSALVMGVRDYFQKQSFSKALFGLSGGIDSALVACIAADALGAENVLGVMMPSRYSSKESISDSVILTKRLGIATKEITIEGPYTTFLELLTPHFEKRPFDVTEENMQARTRGLILMALSNKLGYVVLSTGNKSEIALGYCTLYGDMCGGLGVIGDVTKTKVYELSRWINRDREIIPTGIMEKAPSAELRPNQKDSDSLPDYVIIDSVLHGYVEDYLTPGEIAKKYAIPIETVLDLIRRIHTAEYKRRQAPPLLRVSKKCFGMGRHYPIVQTWM